MDEIKFSVNIIYKNVNINEVVGYLLDAEYGGNTTEVVLSIYPEYELMRMVSLEDFVFVPWDDRKFGVSNDELLRQAKAFIQKCSENPPIIGNTMVCFDNS